jgi:hypothetical protein
MKQLHTVKVMVATTISMMLICVVVFSCKKDTPLVYNGTFIEKCKNVVCYNGGTCKDGLCVCPIGYEGTDCQSQWNTRYAGNYDAYDECTPGLNYAVNIVGLVNNAAGISINNISSTCPTQSLTANITKERTNIEIPLQQACGNWWMSGTGTQTSSTGYINIFLTARDSLTKEIKTCSIVLRKK